MGIPHPESYKALCQCIRSNWFKINEHVGRYSKLESRLHARKIPDGVKIITEDYNGTEVFEGHNNHIFEMNFKGSFDEQDRNKEDELTYSMNANFVVTTDIANFFPSIYSHALEWAAHGKTESKDNRSNQRNHWGYELDKLQRSTKDNETNGILIGPHSSNILSDIILCKVNEKLRNKGFIQFYHYVDDYTYFAKDHDDAKSFIREFTLVLKDYELMPNEKKTKILPMADALEESWVLDLNQFRFPSGEWLHFSVIESYINRARHLQKQHANSSLLSYAISVIRGKVEKDIFKVHANTKKLYLHLVYSLAIQYPYLCQFIDERVLQTFYSDSPVNKEYLAKFLDKLIENSMKENCLDGLAHALHLALKYDVHLNLSDDTITSIEAARDCISMVLLYEYAKSRSIDSVKERLERIARSLKDFPRRDQDRFWLFIYQTCTKSELQSFGQHFLANLKGSDFKFIKIDQQ